LLLRLGIDYLDLAWTHKYTMVWLAREINDILYASVVLAFGLGKLNTNPFTRRERRGTNEPDDTKTRRHLDERTQRWVHTANEM
jgi:hypothetical protein